MYCIIKISIDKTEKYLSSEIIGYVNSDIKDVMLEQIAINFVKEQRGMQGFDDCKVINIKTFDQVSEPLIDRMLMYRITDDLSKIHVYNRISKQISGYVYGQSVTAEFNKIKIFELIKCETLIYYPTQNEIKNILINDDTIKLPIDNKKSVINTPENPLIINTSENPPENTPKMNPPKDVPKYNPPENPPKYNPPKDVPKMKPTINRSVSQPINITTLEAPSKDDLLSALRSSPMFIKRST